jgi:phage tail sheath protein FI
MSDYKIPGVYIEEQSVFPPSVSAAATAVPAFLGYTTNEVTEPQKIQSLMEFETLFGLPPVSAGPSVTLSTNPNEDPRVDFDGHQQFYLYYLVEHYFRNGGGPCYVISTGTVAQFTGTVDGYLAGLDMLKKLDEPTLIVLSDALLTLQTTDTDYALRHAAYLSLIQAAMDQCGRLKDRFLLLDMPDAGLDVSGGAGVFRGAVGSHASYAAAYYPYLDTTLNRRPVFTCTASSWSDGSVSSWVAVRNRLPIISYNGVGTPAVAVDVQASNPEIASFEIQASGNDKTLLLKLQEGFRYGPAHLTEAFEALESAAGFSLTQRPLPGTPGDYDAVTFRSFALVLTETEITMADLKQQQPTVYAKVAAKIAKEPLRLPPAAAMAGVYASVDRDRGVWKAPANVNISAVMNPSVLLSRQEQELLDVDADNGKSINCILKFTGKGVIPWGARTLDAGNLDWRYISVRRLFIMAEEAVKKASQFAVFEANDKSTWSKVKAMITNYLYSLWQNGALQGGKPEEAFFVQVGLGETMSMEDVLEGRMIVQVGMAAVRPAEFIILRFSQMQQTA